MTHANRIAREQLELALEADMKRLNVALGSLEDLAKRRLDPSRPVRRRPTRWLLAAAAAGLFFGLRT